MNHPYHTLLRRQLKKFFGESFSIPEEWQRFVEAVNAAYHESDVDRNLLERSLELSSQELLQANSEMRAIFEALPDLFFRFTYDGTILDCKAGNSSDLYMIRGKMIGKRIDDLPIPEVRKKFRDAIRQVRETSANIRIEYSLKLSGSEQFYEARLLPILDDQLIAIIRNVTEQRQSSETIREFQRRLADIIEFLPDATLVIDREGKVIAWNKAIEDMTGYRAEEMLGEDDHAYAIPFYGERRPILIDLINMPREIVEKKYLAIRSEKNVLMGDADCPMVRRNRRFLSGWAAPIFNLQGEIVGAIESIRDITTQIQAEKALRESEARFRDLAELLPAVVYETDRDYRLTYANRRAVDLFGYSPEELKDGFEALSIIVPQDRKRVVENFMRQLQGEELGTNEYTGVKKDGSTYPLLLETVPIRRDGKLVGTRGIIIDITERKRAEEKSHNMLNFLQTLIDTIPSPIFCKDVNGLYQDCNKEFEEYTGFKKEEIIGKSVYEMYSQDVADKYHEMDLALFRKPGRQIYEYPIIYADGSKHDVVVNKATYMNADDTMAGLVGIMVDITERKRVEEKLLESEASYRHLFDNSPTGIYQVNFRTGKFLKANDIVCELFGCTQEEITSLSPYELLTDKSKQLSLERLTKMSLGEKVTENPEYEIINKKGERRWVQLNSKNIYDSEGLVGADVVVHDITKRKQAEDALQETQRRLLDIIEFLPDATLVIDRDGMVIAWNRAMESITGVKAGEMIGKGNYEYAIPFYGERMPMLIDFAMHPDKEKEKIYTTIQRTGDIIFGESYTPALAAGNVHLSATASLLRNSRGEIIGAIECIRNNTDRKNMEERLKRAEKMESLGVLAGGVAHDLNNVLGVLVGYSELLLREIPEGSRTEKYAKIILQGGERAAAIIQDLLTMARRGVSVSEAVNLNKVVADYFLTPEFELLKTRHPEILFQSQIGKDLFNIKGSPVHLSKTIMNLMLNAAESIPGTGVVTITTENRYVDLPIPGYENTREGEYVVLTVTDTGSGISPADMGRIFEPFYTKKVMGRSGTGLGLAVVWGTIKDHGGYIDVRSEENKGTTFTLYFPVTRDALSKLDRVLSQSEYRGRGETILIVDDVEEQRFLAATILEGLNYRVATAASGEEAVEYLRANKTDLLVLDMIMEPGIDGLETYRRILENQPQQKAIIVSGFAKTDRVGATQELGAGEYVKKPYVIEKLGIAVRKELDRG